MAVTQYQIFCRYINENVNRPLTNKTTVDWISAEELTEITKFYETNKVKYLSLKEQISNGTLKKDKLSIQDLEIYDKGQRYDTVQDKKSKNRLITECCIVEPADSLYQDSNNYKKRAKVTRDHDLYQVIVDETIATNPKYDMIFMYDGIAYGESRTGKADYNPPQNDGKQVPYVYYDRMKRVKFDAWFLYSTHTSLNSAMTKAREMANILGKDSVKIGKVVPLEHYIEIV